MTETTLTTNSGGADSALAEALRGLRRMNSNRPTQKVALATVAAAVVTLMAWFYESLANDQLPAPVVGALTTIATFAVGWVVPPGSTEQVVRLDDSVGRPGSG